jgi:mediator of DNA damage checkpoint protein 1
LSSFIADTTTDREEGQSTKRTSRRSAANKASQRLREEVMPDVVNFEKEMRRGQVRAANFSPKSERERGQEKTKTGLLAKPLGKGRKRPSIQHAAAMEEDVFSDDEHEHERAHKKQRRSPHDRFEDHDDDERTDVTGISSQGVAEIPSTKGRTAKGTKLKKGDSQSGQVEIEPFLPPFVSPRQRLLTFDMIGPTLKTP